MSLASRLAAFLFPLLLAVVGTGLSYADDTAPCRTLTFEEMDYTICSFDLRKTKLTLYNLDDRGQPYGSFAALAGDLARKGKTLAFAMNAGMYDEGLKPIGLYIEGGKQVTKLNRRNGPGNFHLKPNGVFFIDGDNARILETEAYLRSRPTPELATQSGPMLVINGAIHPRLSPDGQSLKRRNGVGVTDDHTAVFAISEDGVNFYSFARLFRDALGCKNALFFDGTVSSLYSPELGRSDGLFPLGPIIAAVK
jgi:uncharacterized protein YigE (DUF2233 family)